MISACSGQVFCSRVPTHVARHTPAPLQILQHAARDLEEKKKAINRSVDEQALQGRLIVGEWGVRMQAADPRQQPCPASTSWPCQLCIMCMAVCTRLPACLEMHVLGPFMWQLDFYRCKCALIPQPPIADVVYATKGQYLKQPGYKGRGHPTPLITRRCHVAVGEGWSHYSTAAAHAHAHACLPLPRALRSEHGIVCAHPACASQVMYGGC